MHTVWMATDSLIGTKIKRARERKRWTQRQLADALDVNTKTVDNWEAGRTSPRNRTGALEEVLGISLDAEPVQPARESWRDWTDDWERQIVEDRYMPDEDKRFFIEQSREARRAAVAARRERRAAEEQGAARSDRGTAAG